jgi:hypothetical protein
MLGKHDYNADFAWRFLHDHVPEMRELTLFWSLCGDVSAFAGCGGEGVVFTVGYRRRWATVGLPGPRLERDGGSVDVV